MRVSLEESRDELKGDCVYACVCVVCVCVCVKDGETGCDMK